MLSTSIHAQFINKLKVIILQQNNTKIERITIRVNVPIFVHAAKWRTLEATSLDLQSYPPFQINTRPKVKDVGDCP
jgi:hypothetical protein